MNITFDDIADFSELESLYAQGYVSRMSHPDSSIPYDIYSYNNAGDWYGKSHGWTDTLRVTRGIIIDRNTHEIVARPFDKFFNLGTQVPYSTVVDVDKHDSDVAFLPCSRQESSYLLASA